MRKTSALVLIALAAILVAPLLAASKAWPALTATGTTTAFIVYGNDKHAVAAIVTGAPSGCSVQMEGSLDGTNWFNVSGAQSCTAGSIFFSVVNNPLTYVRGSVTTLSGGTSPTVTFQYISTGGSI